MASEERNALAELAERMDRYIDEAHPSWSFREDAVKAQRIVAELAKVGFLKTVDGELVAHPGDACEAAYKCRAIAAEEGANE